MMPNVRMNEHMNAALHRLMETDERVCLIGEDLLDPYGGAFKVSRGLSTRFPDRVLSTPLSESAIVGMAAGLALCGERPIVEIMFGDFAALAFDPLLNFASKSVTMYGQPIALNMLVRCPVGGGRGYGATHSQSLQKHFIGIPNLSLFEMSAYHDMERLLPHLVSLGHPAILFEQKSLYGERIHRGGTIDDLFRFEYLDGAGHTVRIFSESFDRPECLVIAPGGVATRCLGAAFDLFVAEEIGTEIIVPAQLYPFDFDPVVERIRDAMYVFIVEESTPGGTWGADVAAGIYDRMWVSFRTGLCASHRATA